MPFYLGNPPGQAQLTAAIRPHQRNLVRVTNVKATIGGGQVVTKAPGPGRATYQLTWNWLLPEEFSVLEEFYTDARGPGPHALLDPSRRNLLTANQSSTGGVFSDTTGFSVDPSEALSLTTALLSGSSVSTLRWSLPGVATAGVLSFTPPGTLGGIPAPAGQAWTFSCQVAGGGNDPAVLVTPALLFLDATGVATGVVTGTPAVVGPGAFTALSVTAGLPLGQLVRPQLLVDVTTVTGDVPGPGDIPVRRFPWGMPVRRATPVGPLPAAINRYTVAGSYASDVLVARPMLDMWGSVRTWALGTGVPLVTLVSMPDTGRVLPWRDVTATLVEVG
jgi:hypothetical protein